MRKRKTVQQTVIRIAASERKTKCDSSAARFSFDAICLCAERPKVDAAMWSEHSRSKFARALEESEKVDH